MESYNKQSATGSELASMGGRWNVSLESILLMRKSLCMEERLTKYVEFSIYYECGSSGYPICAPISIRQSLFLNSNKTQSYLNV